MNEPDRDAEPAPSWLPWVCLGLLTLPFHPLWIDFEQVRRGALLVLAGALFAAHRRLPKVQGGTVGLLLVCSLVSGELGGSLEKRVLVSLSRLCFKGSNATKLVRPAGTFLFSYDWRFGNFGTALEIASICCAAPNLHAAPFSAGFRTLGCVFRFFFPFSGCFPCFRCFWNFCTDKVWTI